MKYLRAFWRWLFKSADSQAPRKKVKRQAKEHFGAHYYLGDLLDRLDDVFDDLPRVRRLDPEAFAAYQRIGATVVSSDGLFSTALEPSFLQALPGFGCAFFGGQNTKEYFGTRFGCFMKEQRPVNVQPGAGAIYRCTVTYSEDDKAPFADQFFVSVEGGEVRALKQCAPKKYKIGKYDQVTRMEWRHSPFLRHVAKGNSQTIDQAASEVFAIIANTAQTREMGMTVRVKKGRMAAAFAIDMLRTPYFFADREKVVTESGATKKIIHHVRGHHRTLAGGVRRFVKPHFRGLREFEWNGYDVRVSMAGKHGKGLSTFAVAAADPMTNDKTVTMEEMARRLDEVIV